MPIHTELWKLMKAAKTSVFSFFFMKKASDELERWDRISKLPIFGIAILS